MLKQLAIAVTVAIFSLIPSSDAKAATLVDVELQLLIDVSGSVDSTEFTLQRDGYVNAFKSVAIQNAILNDAGGTRLGQIAAEVIYWSGRTQQAVAVGWSLLDSVASIDAFANAIETFARPFSGLTAIGSAIDFGYQRFASNGFEGTSKVIDVSGDGSNNDGIAVATARDAALAAGITRINGLPIGGGLSLQTYYQNNVIGGSGAFLVPAATFGDFSDAVSKKLAFEITGGNPNPIPLPASAWLLLAAMGGMGFLRRRKTG